MPLISSENKEVYSMEKVRLPREVAEAIEYLCEKESSNYKVAHRVFYSMRGEPDYPGQIVYEYFNGDMDELIKVLINGYEIEQTPEDVLRMYYDHFEKKKSQSVFTPEYKEYLGKIIGIRMALRILGIKIEGIND
jgi:hypothetical protein